jgi:hypothetical protein
VGGRQIRRPLIFLSAYNRPILEREVLQAADRTSK